MIESFDSLQPETSFRGDKSNTSKKIFVAALIIGVVLRLVTAFVGDIGPGGDGVQRLWLATDWARNPRWQGLSGVWPPTHWYFLGSLIHLWNQPIILAKAVNFLCGIGSIIAFRAALRTVFGDMIASVSALILAIFWTHIWLTTAYWVELPYLLLVFLSIHFATRGLAINAADTKALPGVKSTARDAFLAGFFLAAAMLLRHEGLLLFALFGVWYVVNVRRLPVVAAFAVLPLCMAFVHLGEPMLRGQSYFQFAAIVKSMKADENMIQGFTLADCLKQWIMMPAIVPSLFVVLPGFYGLWKARRLIRYDLFGWIFISHLLLFLFMTFSSHWRPQLRYIMLYFVNMLPYCALIWVQWMRVSWRPVLAGLVTITILLQAAGWWVGRNEKRPLGWLPIQVRSESQIALDNWLPKVQPLAVRRSKIVSLAPGNLDDPWSLVHSTLVNNVDQRRIKTLEIYMPEEAEMLKGNLSTRLTEGDVILIDPEAIFYKTIVDSLHQVQPTRKKVKINAHIIAYVNPKFMEAEHWQNTP